MDRGHRAHPEPTSGGNRGRTGVGQVRVKCDESVTIRLEIPCVSGIRATPGLTLGLVEGSPITYKIVGRHTVRR